jgi:hypothetical protein
MWRAAVVDLLKALTQISLQKLRKIQKTHQPVPRPISEPHTFHI